jgi:hypothetical protein
MGNYYGCQMIDHIDIIENALERIFVGYIAIDNFTIHILQARDKGIIRKSKDTRLLACLNKAFYKP